jgi:hypothetical protein
MNELTVEGPAKELAKFRKAATGRDDEDEKSVLDFESLRPTPSPKEFKKLPADEFSSPVTDAMTRILGKRAKDWYTWRLANWGTKWRAGYTELRGSKGLLVYSFDTAWSPPKALFLYVSNIFPSLSFCLKYGEAGNNFQGKCSYKGGEETYSEEGSFCNADWGMDEPDEGVAG